MTTRSGTYVGRRSSLHGRRALVMLTDTAGVVQAQFNDYETGLAHGWHRFPEGVFRYDPKVDWTSDTHDKWRELNST